MLLVEWPSEGVPRFRAPGLMSRCHFVIHRTAACFVSRATRFGDKGSRDLMASRDEQGRHWVSDTPSMTDTDRKADPSEERASARARFLDAHGWPASWPSRWSMTARSGATTGSRRRPPGHSDGCAADKEDVRSFVTVGRRLEDWGYAPRIHGEDPVAGFLLLDDFGDRTFTRALAEGTDERSSTCPRWIYWWICTAGRRAM